jgi:ketosteroid isomerase-like protein
MVGRVYEAVARPLLIAGALIAHNELLAAQQTGDEAAVRAVVARFHTAVTAGNAAQAMAVVGADAVFLEAGSVETRAQYEKDHLPADIEFEKSVPIKRGELRVIVSGDAAWSTCTYELKGTFQGRAIDSIGTEMMVLSRTAGGWQIRAVSWSSRARPAAK